MDAAISAESLGIKPIEEDMWTFFDKRQFDACEDSKVVSLSKLIHTKIHVPDPDVATGKKPHPVHKAYSYFLRAAAEDPLVSPRKPITVTANSDGTYTIVDGYATVQATIFVRLEIRSGKCRQSLALTTPTLKSSYLLLKAQSISDFRQKTSFIKLKAMFRAFLGKNISKP